MNPTGNKRHQETIQRIYATFAELLREQGLNKLCQKSAKMGFIVLTHEMQNAECKIGEFGLFYIVMNRAVLKGVTTATQVRYELSAGAAR